jgi:hypothetical protein
MNVSGGWMNLDYRVDRSAGEAHELSWTNDHAHALDFDDEFPSKHDETFVAVRMEMGSDVFPGLIGVFVPDVQQIRAERNIVRRLSTHQKG